PTYPVTPAAARSKAAAIVPITMPLLEAFAGVPPTGLSLTINADPKGLVSASAICGAVSARDSATSVPLNNGSSFGRSSRVMGCSVVEAVAALRASGSNQEGILTSSASSEDFEVIPLAGTAGRGGAAVSLYGSAPRA